MAVYYRTFSTWLGRDGIWLEDLFVRPEYRRHGLGQRAARRRCDARTAGRVEWAVLDWNEPAQDFYRALGAAPLDDWTVWRVLTGLTSFAAASARARCARWSNFAKWDTVWFPQFLGLELEEVRADYARMRLAYRRELDQPAGVVHGGVIATMIDTVVVPAVGTGYDEPAPAVHNRHPAAVPCTDHRGRRRRRRLGRAARPFDRVLRRRGAFRVGHPRRHRFAHLQGVVAAADVLTDGRRAHPV